MKKIIAGIVIASTLALTGCQSGGSTSVGGTLAVANNALAQLAKYDLPTACTIVGVAEGYFETLRPRISAANQQIYAQASAAVNSVCNNPPTNVAEAFLTLVNAWNEIQNATKAK